MKSLLTGFKLKYVREMAQFLRNGKWSQDNQGLIIPDMRIKWSGLVRSFSDSDGLGETIDHNDVTTEGLNHILDAVLHGSTQYTTWYLAPWTDNVSVQATWTAATFSAAAGELTTQYTQSTRVAFVESAAAAGVTHNTANPATFTSSVDSVVIRGLALLSHSTKGSTSGVLLSAIKYGTARTLVTTGDSIGLTYQITLSDT